MTSTYVAGNLPKLHACVARPRRRAAAPCEQGIRSRHPARDPPLVLLVNIGVWAIIDGSVSDANDRAQTLEGLQWSGAAFYPFVYAMVIGITSISATFPLALAYSVTRRHFAVGSAITYAMLSAFFAAIFTVLALIEAATGGWRIRRPDVHRRLLRRRRRLAALPPRRSGLPLLLHHRHPLRHDLCALEGRRHPGVPGSPGRPAARPGLSGDGDGQLAGRRSVARGERRGRGRGMEPRPDRARGRHRVHLASQGHPELHLATG